jgi:hypothetical protein
MAKGIELDEAWPDDMKARAAKYRVRGKVVIDTEGRVISRKGTSEAARKALAQLVREGQISR